MYRKWVSYTREHPIVSILIAVVLGSVLGISIEYLVNKDIRFEGLLGLVIVTLIQLQIVSTSKK